MPSASSTSRWQEDSVPLSQVRSILAGAGMSLWMSYSARGGQRALVVKGEFIVSQRVLYNPGQYWYVH